MNLPCTKEGSCSPWWVVGAVLAVWAGGVAFLEWDGQRRLKPRKVKRNARRSRKWKKVSGSSEYGIWIDSTGKRMIEEPGPKGLYDLSYDGKFVETVRGSLKHVQSQFSGYEP